MIELACAIIRQGLPRLAQDGGTVIKLRFPNLFLFFTAMPTGPSTRVKNKVSFKSTVNCCIHQFTVVVDSQNISVKLCGDRANIVPSSVI